VLQGGVERGAVHAFLKRLTESIPEKVFLIVDNLRVHHSVKVRKWVEAHKQRICLYFLPPYAPEHNPDEYLNNDVKQQMKNLPRPDSQDELVQSTASVMRSIQKQPHRVRSYFRAPDVRYAA
jgi:transposase